MKIFAVLLNTEHLMLKSRIIFFMLLLSLAILYVGGCRRAGEWLVKENVPVHADAMVLLMGSFPERVLEAVDLYQRQGRQADHSRGEHGGVYEA